MTIFATTIHALSAIAFVVIGLLVLSNDGTLATNDVTITLALLGFNVMIRYITTTGGEQADAADTGRHNERGQIEPEAAAPERRNRPERRPPVGRRPGPGAVVRSAAPRLRQSQRRP